MLQVSKHSATEDDGAEIEQEESVFMVQPGRTNTPNLFNTYCVFNPRALILNQQFQKYIKGDEVPAHILYVINTKDTQKTQQKKKKTVDLFLSVPSEGPC